MSEKSCERVTHVGYRLAARVIIVLLALAASGWREAVAAPQSQSSSAAMAAEPQPRDSARRSPDGRLMVTAAPVTEGVRIDGVLDDEVWRRAVPAGGFVQSEPREGAPATEPTEVRVAYDAANLYIAAYLHDREP